MSFWRLPYIVNGLREAAMESADKQARTLSKEENDLFDGITIEDGKIQESTFFQVGVDNAATISIGGHTFRTDSIWVRIAIGIVLAIIVALLLFIALPIALIILGVLLVIWFILSFFGKK